MVAERVLVDAESSQTWTAVAHGARIAWRVLGRVPPRSKGSKFSQLGAAYPFESVEDRSRSYVWAALEHLLMWADHAAPLKFHPDQEAVFQQRPPYTLARAALEAAAQAIWMLDTPELKECIRRHLSLLRWDLREQAKSSADPKQRHAIATRDRELLDRISADFTEAEVAPPRGYLWVLRQACTAPGLALDAADVERLWRAASGSAHGMYWPTQQLQVVVEVPLDGGGTRQIRVADASGISEVLQAAYSMSMYALLKYAEFAGADIAGLLAEAMAWLAGEVTPLDEATTEVLDTFKARSPRLTTP